MPAGAGARLNAGRVWHDLFAAIALMLVFEGIMPFLNPQHFRRTLQGVARLHDRTLRAAGLVAMLAGVVLLYAAR